MARHTKKIHYTHWTGFTFALGAQAAGNSGSTLFSAQHEPETLMRTRGNFLAYIDGVQTPGTGVIVGVGMIPVPEDTGSTVHWSPISDPDAPWLWYERFVLGYEEMVTDVVDVPGITVFRSVIDSKAMRILRNQEVQFVVENATVLAAGSVNVFAQGRTLFGTG